ncbi:MAG: HAD family hydrolase [Patescibacteria group bacterium]|nr:HAD family hydrolase [Patescibacteria group bacterium]MCL5095845.1 HAD family hydrolase [Patescibacteria group bacterium]
MDQRFKDIKVIAWDLDTTLYKPNPVLGKAFLDGCIEEVAKVKNLSFARAEKLFNEERKKTNSSTQVLLNFFKMKTPQDVFYKMWEIQKRIGKINYLHKDPKLPEMFDRLSGFHHFIISNSVPEEIENVLSAIGLDSKYFEKLISVVDTGEPKPSLKPFRSLLELTGLPSGQHLMIGDREDVDIEPAKKLGFKTILVWGQSFLADASLSSVYEVAELLL